MIPSSGQSGNRSVGGARFATAVVALSAAALSAGAFVLGGGWALLQPGGWQGAAARSRGFLVCGLVTGVCLALLAVLGGALWLAGAARRAQRSDLATGEPDPTRDIKSEIRNPKSERAQEGAVTVEFALVLPIALMIFLIMTQSALLMGGSLCVNYAAFCAARSAIVQVPRNLGVEEPPNVVGDPASSAKMQSVKSAAVWALLPVSCSSPDAPGVDAGNLQAGLSSVLASFGSSAPAWARDRLSQRLGYARQHTEVDLAPPRNGPRYDANEDLKVTLRHDFYLSVPYAARIFSQAADGVRLEFGSGEFATVIRVDCTLTNEGEQDWVDVEHFPRPRR